MTSLTRPDMDAAYRLWAPSIQAYFLRHLVGSAREQSQDLVADTFVRAWEHRLLYLEHGHMNRWLCRLAHSILVDYLRRRSRSPVTVPFEDWQSFPQHSSFDWLETAEQVEAVLDKLPRRHALLLEMAAEGFTDTEIAKLLGVAANAQRQLKWRARASAMKAVQLCA